MKQRNFWPLGIFLVTMAVVGLIIWTVNLALKNPVELENSYMTYYQDVDGRINEIQRSEKHFWGIYELKGLGYSFALSEPKGITLRLVKREGGADVSGAKATFRLTRPHTAREDIELGEGIELEAGVYATPAITFPKPGRWKLQGRLETDQGEGHFEREISVR